MKKLSALAITLLLIACSSTPDGKWQKLGEADNGNVEIYLDQSSVKRKGSLVTFRDRKTVVSASEARFVNVPAYKNAIGEWEMDCRLKNYRLSSIQLLDRNGKTVASHRYQSQDVRPMPIQAGSINEKQYKLVCAGK